MLRDLSGKIKMPNGFIGQNLQEKGLKYKKKTQNPIFKNSLGTKFQPKLTILIYGPN